MADEDHDEIMDIGRDTDRILEKMECDEVSEGFDSGMLAGLLGNRGIDPGIVAMLNNKARDGDWGANGGIWIILLFLLILGVGGRGFGNVNGNDSVSGIDRTVVNEANYTRLLDAISSQGTKQEIAFNSLASALNVDNSAIRSALAGLDKEIAVSGGDLKSAVQSCCCNIRTEIANTQNALQAQLAKCCCDTNLNIERQGCQTRNDIQETRFLIQTTDSATRQMILDQFCSQNAYLADQFCQIKSREDQREIQTLRDRLAEQRDNANTLAILNAISNKDTIGFTGTVTDNTVSGTGTLS